MMKTRFGDIDRKILVGLLLAALGLFEPVARALPEAVAETQEDRSEELMPPPTPAEGVEMAPDAVAAGETDDAAASETEVGEEEINLLDDAVANQNLLAGADGGDVGREIGDVSSGSFGAQLEAFGLEAEISGYGETVFYIDGEKATFDLWHFVPIIGVQIGDTARAEIELEYEHGGSEQKVEYAFFEYAPYRALSVRFGKFNVPLGYFNAVLHPSFRWNQINRPAMFTNVVPATWNEVGAQLFGRVELGPTSTFEYDFWVTNGLGYEAGTDLASKPAFVRKLMRGNVRDNNLDKAVGGRLGLRVLAAEGAVRIISGLSFYTAAVDPAGSQRLSILDYDVWVQAGDFMLRGEVAQSFWSTSASATISPLERGAYLQMAYTLQKWTLALRWDNTFIKPGMGLVELHNSLVPTLKFAPDALWSVRVETALPLDETLGGMPRVDFMVSFSF